MPPSQKYTRSIRNSCHSALTELTASVGHHLIGNGQAEEQHSLSCVEAQARKNPWLSAVELVAHGEGSCVPNHLP